LDELGFKRKYLTRLTQEKEAEQEIKQYAPGVHDEEPTTSGEMYDAQNVDEERSVRNVQA